MFVAENGNDLSIIGEVLGITDRSDTMGSLEAATEVLTGAPIDWVQDSVIGEVPVDQMSQTQSERAFDLGIICQLLTGSTVRSASTLTDWQVYHRLMNDFGTRADGNATALLIGALSALSARSFECIARTEYGANKALIVDPLAGRDKMRHGTFMFGSGLELPFADESIDFVHTNQLLHALEDPSGHNSSPRGNRLRLFREIGRVVAPGGQVLMKEFLGKEVMKLSRPQLYDASRKAATSIVSTLQSNGFDTITARIARDTTASSAGYGKYVFDPASNIDPTPGFVTPANLEIYAQKAPQHLIAIGAQV